VLGAKNPSDTNEDQRDVQQSCLNAYFWPGLAREILDDLGHNIISVGSGREALRQLLHQDFEGFLMGAGFDPLEIDLGWQVSQITIEDLRLSKEEANIARMQALTDSIIKSNIGAGIMIAFGPAWGILLNVLIYLPLVGWLWKAPYGPKFRKDQASPLPFRSRGKGGVRYLSKFLWTNWV
jgi:CheY-like chemotaxis protein